MTVSSLQVDQTPVPSLPRPLLSTPTFTTPMQKPRPVVNLHTLHQDVLYQIILRLNDMGGSLHSLSLTSWRLNRIVHAIRRKGRLALPIRLPVPFKAPRGMTITRASRAITLRKNHVPGDTFLVFGQDVSQTSAIFHFRIDQLNGHRLDIGLAHESAFRFLTVERASSWSFDCFGRVSMAGRRMTYGRQMRTGDVVSVVYDAGTCTLSFLDNGVSMGALSLRDSANRVVERGTPLFPYVYFPYCEGEAVTIVRAAQRCVMDLRRVHASVARWRRPLGLPCDGCIIVETWEERTWYAIDLDPERDSMATLWLKLQERHGMDMSLFELIFQGKRLEYSQRTLKDAGIIIDKRTGTCSSDILLSVPHIVS